MKAMPLSERLAARTERQGDCLIVTTSILSNGYGSIRADAPSRKSLKAHRVAYELHYGEIPKGMVIDHICRNRACVEPTHLRAVTHKQNAENQSRMNRNSKSGIRGVFLNEKSNRWGAQVKHDGVNHWLGYFDTSEEADRAATELRLKLQTHNDADRVAN
ncbi:hypothetical protein AQ436_00275 [Arthrobacter sp. EpRS66]|nr:hypothetical protein AQ436_00275 [Arthrobacter sp. EpRS66]